MDPNSYVTFLLLGALLVLIDGQLIVRSGRGYVRKVYEPEAASSMMYLVAVLFHLVVLGLLALISLINVDTGLPIRDLVVKLGVLLLVLAAAHGFTIMILMRIRDRRWQEQISDQLTESRYGPSRVSPQPNKACVGRPAVSAPRRVTIAWVEGLRSRSRTRFPVAVRRCPGTATSIHVAVQGARWTAISIHVAAEGGLQTAISIHVAVRG